MGKIFSPKEHLKWVGVDMDANKKAAQDQAKAIRESSDRVAADNLLAAQANQAAIEATQAQNAARAGAADLLNRPMDTASVDLSKEDADLGDEDLLGRRRSIRNSYRAPRGGSSGLLV